MQLNSDLISYSVGTDEILSEIIHQSAFPAFDDTIISFLDTVSKYLLKLPEAKEYPDVITFAFWCRKSSMQKFKALYDNNIICLGRGVVFHIAPSNVPVNFAYSAVAGLLGGNANVVRLPSKNFTQVSIICDAFNDSLNKKFHQLKPYLLFIKYGHDQRVNDYLSSICDTRIVWGGDLTISTVRRSPLKARATEIAFADRYSLCYINADDYLALENKQKTARDFYNDTYLSDQNACTSPKIIIWQGENISNAKDIFWESLHEIVATSYDLQPIQVVNKITNIYLMSLENDSLRMAHGSDNYIHRLYVERLNPSILNHNINSGIFIEHSILEIKEIYDICNDNRCQTLSYIANDADLLIRFVQMYRPKGIDRIVPVGKTMDFSLVWDGFDLIKSMSRIVSAL